MPILQGEVYILICSPTSTHTSGLVLFISRNTRMLTQRRLKSQDENGRSRPFYLFLCVTPT